MCVLCVGVAMWCTAAAQPPERLWVHVIRFPAAHGPVLDVDRHDVRVADGRELRRCDDFVVVGVGGVTGSARDDAGALGTEVTHMSEQNGSIIDVDVAGATIHWVRTHLGAASRGDRRVPTGTTRVLEGRLWIEVSAAP